MNFRKFKTLIIGGVLGLICLGVSGYFFMKFRKQHREATSTYESARTTAKGLESQKPFPNEDNLKLLEEDLAFMKKYRGQYVTNLFASVPRPLPITPLEFRDRLNNLAGQWMKRAATREGDRKEILLPSGYSLPANPYLFGFGPHYELGKVPKDEFVPRLTVQLQVVKSLIESLFDAGITHLHAIERPQFEDALAVGEEFGFEGQGFRSPRPRATRGKDSLGDVEQESDLYFKEVYRINFECKEDVLWKVLNQLNQLPYPVSIKQLAMKNQNPELQPKDLVTAGGGEISARPRLGGRGIGGSTDPYGDYGFEEDFVDPLAPSGPRDPLSPTPPQNEREQIEFVSGLEGVQVTLELEVFSPPSPKSETETGAAEETASTSAP